MNARHLIATLAALSATTVCATSYADVGWMDGDNTYSRLNHAGRAGWNSGYDLTGSAALPSGAAAVPSVTGRNINSETGDVGPRGVSGSRYSTRTREEVIDELKEYQRTHPTPLRPGDTYFGG